MRQGEEMKTVNDSKRLVLTEQLPGTRAILVHDAEPRKVGDQPTLVSRTPEPLDILAVAEEFLG
jgi:hypothetical protein